MARKHKEGGGTDIFTVEDTPERSVDDPHTSALPGPQADAVEAGKGAPAGDPRSPSGPEPAMVDKIHRAVKGAPPPRPSPRSKSP